MLDLSSDNVLLKQCCNAEANQQLKRALQHPLRHLEDGNGILFSPTKVKQAWLVQGKRDEIKKQIQRQKQENGFVVGSGKQNNILHRESQYSGGIPIS